RIDACERPLGLDDRVAELDQSVARDELARCPSVHARGDRVGYRVLQLEHDALRSLLADTGNRLEARRIAESDRTLQVRGRRTGDDGQGDFRADPADPQKMDEERP